VLKGNRVTLRSVEREDLPILSAFNNDLEVELASACYSSIRRRGQ